MRLDILDKFEELMPMVFRHLHVSSNTDLINLNITMPQFIVLKLIYKIGNPKMSDLSHNLGVTLGNMTIMADRLIKDGYIVRVSDPDDRRIVRAKLTPSGRSIIKKITAHKRSYTRRIFSILSKKDQRMMIGIFEKIAREIKNIEEEK